MTTSIAKEAFVEAKELRKIAEQNAKRALLEQVTPTIREMIEKNLLNEAMYGEDEDILVDALPSNTKDVPPPATTLAPEMPIGGNKQVDVSGGEPGGITLPGSDGKITLDVDSLQADDDVMLTAESIEALASLSGAKAELFGVQTLRINKKLLGLNEQKENNVSYSEKLKQIKVEIESMYKRLQETKIPQETKKIIEENLEELYIKINSKYIPVKTKVIVERCQKVVQKARKLNEVSKTHNFSEKAKELFGNECLKTLKESIVLHSSLTELSTATENNKKLGLFINRVANLCKEIFDMANKRGTLNEGALRLILRDLPDEIDVGSLSVDVEPAPEDMGMDDDMGDDELGLDLGAGDEGGDPGAELEMPDLEEVDMAIDVGLPDDVDVDASAVSADASALDDDMGDMDMGGGSEPMDDEDEVVEISEAMLKKELQRLRARRLNETPVTDVSRSPREYDGTSHGPKGMEDQFGGGTETGEPFVDRDDSDLNTLGESELDEMADLDEEEEEEMDESELQSEGVRKSRALQEKVNAYKAAASKLKKQLGSAQKQIAEANLFNAKLVYANKLLSNGNLTQKQKVAIVDALQGAESIKEVKKLFAHLNEALLGKKGKSKLTENAARTVLGGGSRVQKSGASSEEGLNEAEKKEYGRWGELAGFLRD